MVERIESARTIQSDELGTTVVLEKNFFFGNGGSGSMVLMMMMMRRKSDFFFLLLIFFLFFVFLDFSNLLFEKNFFEGAPMKEGRSVIGDCFNILLFVFFFAKERFKNKNEKCRKPLRSPLFLSF